MAKLAYSAVILAGGDSKRMGTNKAFLKLGNKSLIEIIFQKLDSLFSEVIVVTDHLEEFSYLPVKLAGDVITQGEKSALRGIHAGLLSSTAPASFVVACDMPFISLPLVNFMANFASRYDAVIPRIESYYQPLFAFYHRTTLKVITSFLEKNLFKIAGFYPEINIKEIHEETVRYFDPLMLSFFNINTKEDYALAKEYYVLKRSCYR